jgi:hypothetical protein
MVPLLAFLLGWTLSTMLTASGGAVSDPKATPACELGAVVLSRLPNTGTPRTAESVYDTVNDQMDGTSGGSNIFKVCPSLLTRMPPGSRAATADEIRRATVMTVPDPMTIFWIAAPLFKDDGATAVVTTGYRCPGLCAGYFQSIYKRTEEGWTLRAPPRMTAMS